MSNMKVLGNIRKFSMKLVTSIQVVSPKCGKAKLYFFKWNTQYIPLDQLFKPALYFCFGICEFVQNSSYNLRQVKLPSPIPKYALTKQSIIYESIKLFNHLPEEIKNSDLVKNIPDASIQEDNENNALADSNVNFGIIPDDLAALPLEAQLPPPKERRKNTPQAEQSSSSGSRTPGVIQFVPKQENPKFNFTVNSLIGHKEETKEEIPFVPSLVPLSTNSSSACTLTGDNLCIDEDYDN
ncbi:unnamed protein product [Ceutorhynchus assimilis]|uniref:Uncharacterized protein n=1 Tax=Ceutorhynchus assimilis TaxID=467358 RepID=A0A9N9MF45_9CUCU|nr:unnamed protein product [Ceutorhynchus assimilis]